ncbi:MAG TPA: glycosyl hydrolase [Candidatus Baltobacteraceae bacterium]|nr:glycosyl hydrolase [Candidatus Baltobacteraceae bacterium]
MRYFQALTIASFVLALSACGQTPTNLAGVTPAPAATRTPASSPVVAGQFTPPPGSIYFGAYVDPSGLAHGFAPADVAQFESQIGRTLTLHTQYLSFTANFAGNLLTDDYVHFRVPVVSWNCQFPDAKIVDGSEDGAIQNAAQQAKSFSGPIFIRYMWDMNLPSTEFARNNCYNPALGDPPDNQFSPSQFIAAWQHIHNIFTQAGATNVIWLWTVSADPNAFSPMQYYPGSQWVDWVGMDAYDLTNGSAAATFQPLYATLSALNKPIMIAETGAAASIQPSFFPTIVPTLKTQFPNVKAFCYYDAINFNGADNQDWRITTAAWPAFLALANDPYMSGTYAP